MINNINYTIKIDYKAFCKQYVENIKTIYGLTDKDVENLPLDLPVITKWVEKVQDDHLIKKLKEDELTTVIKIMEARKWN